jgi:NAD(P)-dependent dehydrogenase (short-subunit alcohol dehydrogenase family)
LCLKQPGLLPALATANLVQEGSGELTADIHLFDKNHVWIGCIEGLRLRRANRNLRASANGDWLYEANWTVESTLPPQPKPSGAGRWLIFADRNGFGRRLAERLGPSTLVFSGKRYALRNDGLEIAPDQLLDFQRLLHELGTSAAKWNGVLYLWGLDCHAGSPVPDPSLVGALHLVQALVTSSEQQLPRLWFITRGAQPAGPAGPVTAPLQAALWGMGNTVALEHPQLNCNLIDLDPEASEEELPSVAMELWSPSGERRIGRRGGKRYVQRLRRISAEPAGGGRQIEVVPQRSYLITGGLGGLGLATAQWLVQNGATHLVLLGRRDVAAPAILAEQDVTIVTRRADVARLDELQHVFKEFGENLPELHGIFHSAGVLADATLLEQRPEHLAAVMAAKAQGALNLHELARDCRLGYFVLYSSTASMLGSIGQANYAAANAVVDSVAAMRHRSGLSALTVNWGAWAEVGMAASMDAHHRDRLSHAGIRFMSASQALAALSAAIRIGSWQAVIADIDWPSYAEAFPPAASEPFFQDVISHETVEPDWRAGGPDARERILHASGDARLQIIREAVADMAARVLHLPSERIELTRPLAQRGFDSLMALELLTEIEKRLGKRVKVTSAMTVDQIAAALVHAEW